MTKNELIKSAALLVQPKREITEEFAGKKESLVAKVLDELRQRPDLEKLTGKDNTAMMVDNIHNMARFMESIFTLYDPTTFVETILWVFRAYRSHGFRLTFWSAHLNTWIGIIQTELTDNSAGALLPFYEWMQTHIPVFTALTDADLINMTE